LRKNPVAGSRAETWCDPVLQKLAFAPRVQKRLDECTSRTLVEFEQLAVHHRGTHVIAPQPRSRFAKQAGEISRVTDGSRVLREVSTFENLRFNEWVYGRAMATAEDSTENIHHELGAFVHGSNRIAGSVGGHLRHCRPQLVALQFLNRIVAAKAAPGGRVVNTPTGARAELEPCAPGTPSARLDAGSG
jgi:hypothetical protein